MDWLKLLLAFDVAENHIRGFNVDVGMIESLENNIAIVIV